MWFLSSATRDLEEIEIVAGEETRLALGSTVVLDFRADLRGRRRQVRLGVSDRYGGGVSLYRDGEKIGFRYGLLDAEGGEVGTGPIDYG